MNLQDNGIVEITRDNYKNFKWNERIKYKYKGLIFECDHEYDAGTYMIWLSLPSGLYEVFKEKNIPYKHQFDAGYMSSEPYFLSTVVEIMDYIDEYYEYFKPTNIDELGSNTENIKDNKVEENTSNSNMVEDISCFACGNVIKMDWSKVPNTEKTIYLKCSKCGTSLKRGNPYATEEKQNNNTENKEQEMRCNNCGRLITNINWATFPKTMEKYEVKCARCGNIVTSMNPYTTEITTETTEQLVKELREYIINTNGYLNIFEDWNECKKDNPQLKEFFDETEKRAKEELIDAKDKAIVLNNKLSTYLSIPDSNELLIEYFGIMSIYDMKAENIEGRIFESMSIDNVGLFRAVLMINIVAIMYHISDSSLPMGLKVIFERKEFADIIGPIIKDFLPKVIPSVSEIKFFAKS